MPQYFSPGVYIQEVETGPVPIQGVSTSITGAVGVTLKGPTSGKPVLVTSFNDFQTTFGGFLTPPDQSQINQWLDPVNGGAWWQFPLSVKGYFDNGGQQLYVKRVVSSFAQPAAGSLGQGLVADLTKNVPLPAATDDRDASTLSPVRDFQVLAPGDGRGDPWTREPAGDCEHRGQWEFDPVGYEPDPLPCSLVRPLLALNRIVPRPGHCQALKPGRDVVDHHANIADDGTESLHGAESSRFEIQRASEG